MDVIPMGVTKDNLMFDIINVTQDDSMVFIKANFQIHVSKDYFIVLYLVDQKFAQAHQL